MAQTGYFLIADISGYTAFLTQSELEHAQDILENLFHALLDNIKHPLIVSKLEGDAIFCYAPDGSVLLGQTLLENVEKLYYTFASVRERMRANTTCTCTACTLIPTLDLKFAMHHGEYGISDMGVQKELQGSDVIVVHRLLKNTVDETYNTKSYAFLTQAAADAMQISEICAQMKPHTEQYEHIGEVKGYIHELRDTLARQREQNRVVIAHETAWKNLEITLPVSPSLVWDYITDPQRMAIWMGLEEMRIISRNKGRTGSGTLMHCIHGKTVHPIMIEDWQPFDYITYSMAVPMVGRCLYTMHLIPEGDGTRLIWSFDMLGSNAPMTFLSRLMFTSMMEGDFKRCRVGLSKLIGDHVEAERVVTHVDAAPVLAVD
jgi:uncharacterized protein YndB with AHSA1/START domain